MIRGETGETGDRLRSKQGNNQREIGDQPGTYDIVDTRTEGKRDHCIVCSRELFIVFCSHCYWVSEHELVLRRAVIHFVTSR